MPGSQAALLPALLAHGHTREGAAAGFDSRNDLQVSLIVMITRLVEGQKVKANQYWPDSAEETKMGPELEVVF